MGIKNLEKENPVFYPAYEEEFNNTLKKAGLLYDTIDRPSRFQYAMLSNKDTDGITLVYVEEKTGKVCTRNMKCNRVKETSHAPDGFFYICEPRLEEPFNQGLIAHNGRIVIMPLCSNMETIQNLVLATEKIETISSSYQTRIYDLEGNMTLPFYGEVTKLESTLTLSNRSKANVLVDYDTEFRNSRGEIPGKVYIINKGELYFIDNVFCYGFSVRVDKNAICFTSEEEKTRLEVEDIERIMEKVK